MFRTRYEELNNLIELDQNFDPSTTIYRFPESIQLHIENIRPVFKNEIKTFSSKIMEIMFESKLVDYKFIDRVYEFNTDFFEMNLRSIIKSQVYESIGFQITLKIVRGFTYFLQAIVGYEAICDRLKIDISKHKNEAYELLESLKTIIAMPNYNRIPDNQRLRVEKMLSYLKPYARKKPKVTKADSEDEGVSYKFV